MKRVVAITGGIGSGKSTVLGMVKDEGFYVLSADEVNKMLLCDKKYLSELERLFPDAFLEGVFDKRKLSDIVFNNESERLKLNALAHAYIGDIIKREVDNAKDIIFIEIPLLIESGLLDILDDIIVVTSQREVRIKRVEERDRVDEGKVVERMKVQSSDEALIALATYVIDNDSTLDELKVKVVEVIDSIMKNC